MASGEKNQDEEQKAVEELRLLYQVTTQDLAFFKQQQWSVTNYVLLLFAAIFGIAQFPDLNATSGERFVLSSLATVLGITAIALLCKLERSIKARRDRLKKIRRQFTKTFCDAWSSEHKAPDSPAIAYLLGAVIGVSIFVIWWFVFLRPYFAT